MAKLRHDTAHPGELDELDPVEATPLRRRRRLWPIGVAVMVAALVGAAFATSENLNRPDDTVRLAGAAKTFELIEEACREGERNTPDMLRNLR